MNSDEISQHGQETASVTDKTEHLDVPASLVEAEHAISPQNVTNKVKKLRGRPPAVSDDKMPAPSKTKACEQLDEKETKRCKKGPAEPVVVGVVPKPLMTINHSHRQPAAAAAAVPAKFAHIVLSGLTPRWVFELLCC